MSESEGNTSLQKFEGTSSSSAAANQTVGEEMDQNATVITVAAPSQSMENSPMSEGYEAIQEASVEIGLVNATVKGEGEISTIENQAKTAHDVKIPFSCEFCLKDFINERDLRKHRRYVHNTKDFKCKLCGKEFAENRYLATHLKRHAGDKRHKCEICGLKFFERVKLTLHMESHKEKDKRCLPYMCRQCGQKCYNRAAWSDHMNTHTGRRPHKCKQCESAFAHRAGLIRHMHTHSDEKPYVCEICNKGFKFRNKLQEHTAFHTGEGGYRCRWCGRCYTVSSSLKRHMCEGKKKHLNDVSAPGTTYMCGICEMVFEDMLSAETHASTHLEPSRHESDEQDVNGQTVTNMDISGEETVILIDQEHESHGAVIIDGTQSDLCLQDNVLGNKEIDCSGVSQINSKATCAYIQIAHAEQNLSTSENKLHVIGEIDLESEAAVSECSQTPVKHVITLADGTNYVITNINASNNNAVCSESVSASSDAVSVPSGSVPASGESLLVSSDAVSGRYESLSASGESVSTSSESVLIESKSVLDKPVVVSSSSIIAPRESVSRVIESVSTKYESSPALHMTASLSSKSTPTSSGSVVPTNMSVQSSTNTENVSEQMTVSDGSGADIISQSEAVIENSEQIEKELVANTLADLSSSFQS